ncbi:Mobile element protein [hydrothermal vent metagenome]|uniref:Mobile element protein n=1 Tax=hydrothermal vent metagenome TaxID=652676 RepID=A0A3B1AN79_9ZZZZ
MIFEFTGIDVGKDKLDLSWLRDTATGRKKSRVFNNTAKDHDAIIAWLLKNTGESADNIVVTLEPTGIYHERLMHTLYDAGFKIFLANPGKAKQYAASRNIIHKTDKSDAMVLARYGASQDQPLKLWQPDAPEIRMLKAMMRRLDALEKDLQREQNRQEAAEFSMVSGRVIQSLRDMIAALNAEIEKLKDDIDDHIDRFPELKENRRLLESIKGIGPVMSRELVYLFAAKLFKNAKQAAAYAGLIPRLRESGTLKGKTTLSKIGPARLRAKLYMAAVSASTHNPDIKAQRERLLSAGKTKMQALGAAMRKLIQICFGVVKHQCEYEPQSGSVTV